MSRSYSEISVTKFAANEIRSEESDLLAVEEPLEIRLGYYNKEKQLTHKAISITMRTPDHDFELAAGFLFTEGIVRSKDQITNIKYCGTPGKDGFRNTVRVDLRQDVQLDLKRLERHFYTSSSCGVCGKSSIDSVATGVSEVVSDLVVDSRLIHELPAMLRQSQSVFDATGGLHASALFTAKGELEVVREDVGRHNALDKVIGAMFLKNRPVLSDNILLVSGRASFELVQKALMAGIPILAAVGSPSSLAVDLAKEFGMTLIGFVRDERFNIYCGKERVADSG